jgi:hypothetical protein
VKEEERRETFANSCPVSSVEEEESIAVEPEEAESVAGVFFPQEARLATRRTDKPAILILFFIFVFTLVLPLFE